MHLCPRKFQVCPVVSEFRRQKLKVCPVVYLFRKWITTGQTWNFPVSIVVPDPLLSGTEIRGLTGLPWHFGRRKPGKQPGRPGVLPGRNTETTGQTWNFGLECGALPGG